MFSSFQDLFKLFNYLDRISRIRIFLNLFLSFINSLLESVSLSSALLFFSVLFNGQISEIPFLKNYFPFLLNYSKTSFLLLFLILFSFTGIIRIYYLKNTFYLSRFVANRLSSLAFYKVINQDYEYHVERNSSLQASVLTNDVNEAVNSITALLQITSSVFSLTSIIATVILVIYSKSIIFLLSIPIIYCMLYFIYAGKYKKNSKVISDLNGKKIDFVKDTLLSIRNILLSHDQEYYYETFKSIDIKLKEAQAFNNFAAVFPKNAIEIFIIGFLALLFVFFPSLVKPTFLPIFAALIFAMQRLFPLLQMIYYGLSAIQSQGTGIQKLYLLLSLKIKNNYQVNQKKFYFKSLLLKDISFSYRNKNQKVLNKISLEINSGDKIGIYGSSGSGKSTFINILMTLLPPREGEIFLNGKILDPHKKGQIYSTFQDTISHIPQNIHLIDSDIITNIVGLQKNNIDFKKLELILKTTFLYDFISSLPNNINTNVGENGCLLSGGQKQRIGIARELYKMNPILILDEATNALDNQLEDKVLEKLFKLKHLKLIVMISHKKSNLAYCNSVLQIKKGSIYRDN